MIKRMTIMLVLMGAVFGGLYGFQTFKGIMIKKAIGGLSKMPQTVSTAMADEEPWQQSMKAVGSLRAVNGADLSLQVSGIVQSILFNSGDTVTEGQPLLKLVDVDDLAKLKSLQATAENTAAVLKRDEEQFRFNAVSQATLDNDKANFKSAQALVEQQKAVLEQKTLKAPFSGRLGIRSVDLGQFLSAGTTIVSLQSVDPLFVDFYLPQQAIASVSIGQPLTVSVDAFPKERFPGVISAINSKIESGSRNVQVRATLKNEAQRLLPGMFAKVEVDIGKPEAVVTVPLMAIARNSYGDLVYIIDNVQGADGVARQVFVRTMPPKGDKVAVTEGIKRGDSVVIAGQLKLRNGTAVRIDNMRIPPMETAPDIVDK